jgi:hypothetical protein
VCILHAEEILIAMHQAKFVILGQDAAFMGSNAIWIAIALIPKLVFMDIVGVVKSVLLVQNLHVLMDMNVVDLMMIHA